MNRKRLLTAIGAVTLAGALALTGTYAWKDFSQHKTNEFKSNIQYDITLVEDFTEKSDWSVEDPAVNKDVWVANYGDQPAYVRLNFREYAEIFESAYIKDAEGNLIRFAVDKLGNFIECGADDKGAYPVGDTYFVVAQGSDQDVTDPDDTNQNGQIGRYMLDPAGLATPSKTYGGDHRATTEEEEAGYELHTFVPEGNESADMQEMRKLIQWTMGTDIKTMAEWQALPAGEQIGAFWVLDSDGWAYWANPLLPGDKTTLLMDMVTLIDAPEGTFYYAVHTSMQAVSNDELNLWTDKTAGGAALTTALQNHKITYAASVTLNASTLTLNVNGTSQLTAILDPDNTDSKTITWTSSDDTVVRVDENGTVTAMAAGTAVITAKAVGGASAACTVTVNP